MASPIAQAGLANPSTQLETLSKSGVPPKSRLSEPGHAQDLVQELILADRERGRKAANLRGMFNGNPPFNCEKRRAASQAWRANFSSLEGKAYLSNGLVPYYDLFSASRAFIDFQTNHGKGDQQAEWSGIITEELDLALKKWKGFDFNVWSMLYDFVGYGQGFLVWQNAWDWRFKRIGHRKVMVLDGVSCDLETLELLVVRQEYQVHELWSKIRNPDTASAAGWKVSAVKEAIRNAVPHNPNNTLTAWEEIQQELNDHDLLMSCRAATIEVGRVYVREFDGKITESIVTETGDPLFLYRKEGRYDNFNEVLAPFFLEIMDGSWHGATGLGKDIFNMVMTKDRLNCAKVDAAFLRAGITLQSKSASAMSKIGLVQFGGAFNIIPPDFDIQQSAILGDITTIIAVDNDLDMRLSRNTGIYRPSQEKPRGNPRTAREAELDYASSTVLGNSAVNRFYDQLDPAYEELVRRICNTKLTRTDPASIAALDFQECCRRRGVPMEALRDRKSVTAFRSIGNGSLVMRQTAMQSVTPFFQMLPESGRSNFIDDVITVHTNQSKAERWNPKAERMGEPNDQQAWAVLENAAMAGGSEVEWTPTQNNLIHAETHEKASADAAQSLSQGADPTVVLRFMELIGPHIAVHLQKLSQDPSHQEQYKALMEEFGRLGKITDQLHGHVEKMMAQQQEEAQKQQKAQSIATGMDGDTAIKAAETKAKIAMATAKGQQSMQMKAEKHQQQMTQAQQDMAIKDAQAAAQIAIDQAKADAKGETQ